MHSVATGLVLIPGAVALLVLLVFTYLYEQNRHSYFRAWQLAWAAYTLHYAVKAEAGVVTFESDPAAPGPRFRLVYERQSEDEVTVAFFIAPPGGTYAPYVSGRATRRR